LWKVTLTTVVETFSPEDAMEVAQARAQGGILDKFIVTYELIPTEEEAAE
jgi:hypothetical protein